MRTIVNLTGRDCPVRPEDVKLAPQYGEETDAVLDFGEHFRVRLTDAQAKALYLELGVRYDVLSAGRPARKG